MDDVHPFALGRGEPQAPVMLSGLDRLGERLTRRLRGVLEPLVGAKPNLVAEAASVIDYAGWSAEVPEFSSISLYRLNPLNGLSLVRLDGGLIATLVDCFYGGKGSRPLPKRREFTPTEDRLLSRLADQIIAKLAEAWAETLPLEAVLSGRETGLAHCSIAQPEDQLLLQRLTLTLADKSFPIDILMPLVALRAVEPLLDGRRSQAPAIDPIWQARLSRRMAQVVLPAKTVLARPNMSLDELLQLEPGDVIPVHVARSLPLIVGNRIVAHGTIGEQNGRAAFMIETLAQGSEA